MSRRLKKQYIDLDNRENPDSLSDQVRAQCWLESLPFSLPQELAVVFSSAFAQLAKAQGTDEVKVTSDIAGPRQQLLFGELNLLKLFNSELVPYLGTKVKRSLAKDTSLGASDTVLTHKVRLYANIPIRDSITKRITDYYRILIGTSFFTEEAPQNLASIAWFLPQGSLIQDLFTSDFTRKLLTETSLKASLESDKAAEKIALLQPSEVKLVNTLIDLLVDIYDDCLNSICGRSSEQTNRETKMRDYYLKPYVRMQIASQTGLMQGLLATWTTGNFNHQYHLLGKFLDFANYVHMQDSTSFNADIEQYYEQTYTLCKHPQQFSHFVQSLKQHVVQLKPQVNTRRISDYLFLIRDPAVHAYRVLLAQHNRQLVGTGTLNFLNKILAQPISHICEVNVDITSGTNPLRPPAEQAVSRNAADNADAEAALKELSAVVDSNPAAVREWLGKSDNFRDAFINLLEDCKNLQ